GSAALAIDGIGGVGLAGVEVRGGGRGEVTSRGEAEDRDALGVKLPLIRPGPYRPDGPLRIAEHDRMVIPRAEAVLEDDARHAERVQPLGHVLALMFDSEV